MNSVEPLAATPEFSWTHAHSTEMQGAKDCLGNEASEYRGSYSTITTGKKQASNNSTDTTKSYANAIKSEFVPTKDQAVILPAVDGITIKEYACAVGRMIGPKAIRYISRISNGRICIYLDKKETVASLIDNHKSITINNNKIDIRPMIIPAERIILSNVSPVILNKAIEDTLKKMTYESAPK